MQEFRLNKTFSGTIGSVHRIETKLVKPKIVDTLNVIEPTDDIDMLNCNTQKAYVLPVIYQDELELSRGGPSGHQDVEAQNAYSLPFGKNLDGANQSFKEFLVSEQQKYIEMSRLELLQEKLDVYVNKKCFDKFQKNQLRSVESRCFTYAHRIPRSLIPNKLN